MIVCSNKLGSNSHIHCCFGMLLLYSRMGFSSSQPTRREWGRKVAGGVTSPNTNTRGPISVLWKWKRAAPSVGTAPVPRANAGKTSSNCQPTPAWRSKIAHRTLGENSFFTTACRLLTNCMLSSSNAFSTSHLRLPATIPSNSLHCKSQSYISPSAAPGAGCNLAQQQKRLCSPPPPALSPSSSAVN